MSFNNEFRQTLDESGYPLLKNIFSGKFESTDMPPSLMDSEKARVEIVSDRPTGKRVGTPSGLEVDQRRQVPMMTSVMEGCWYGDKPHERMKITQARDHLVRHRKTIANYSKVVRSIKPPNRKSPFPNSSSLSPQVHVPPLAPFEPVIPRDLGELYGREGGDAEVAETITAYLEGAAPYEKRRFLRALQRSDHDRRFVNAARPVSVSPFQPTQSLQPTQSPIPRDGRQPTSAAASSRRQSTAHHQALTQASEFARSSRELRRPDSAHRSVSVPLLPRSAAVRPTTAMVRPASRADSNLNMPGPRPLSRSETSLVRPTTAALKPLHHAFVAEAAHGAGGDGGLRASDPGPRPEQATENQDSKSQTVPIKVRPGGWASPKMVPFTQRGVREVQPLLGERRMANRMHLDLQRAAFGATFNAKRLSQLKQQLHGTDSFALGTDMGGLLR